MHGIKLKMIHKNMKNNEICLNLIQSMICQIISLIEWPVHHSDEFLMNSLHLILFGSINICSIEMLL